MPLRCKAELCRNWDGNGCPCGVLGIEPCPCERFNDDGAGIDAYGSCECGHGDYEHADGYGPCMVEAK